MIDAIPDLNIFDAGSQGYSLYNKETVSKLFENDNNNISSTISKEFGLSTDDIFYYTYAVMHSEDYRREFANDLIRQQPRIPKLKNKDKFIDTGRKLANLHLNYESYPPYEGVKFESAVNPSYKVIKMKHPKKGMLEKIVFNADITITNIPEKAYDYVVNGRPAIEWIMDQYRVKKDEKSGIIDDPNKYSRDEKYIFNLLLRIINVSVQTVDLVENLPPLEIIES